MSDKGRFSSSAVHLFVGDLFAEDMYTKRVASLANATLDGDEMTFVHALSPALTVYFRVHPILPALEASFNVSHYSPPTAFCYKNAPATTL